MPESWAGQIFYWNGYYASRSRIAGIKILISQSVPPQEVLIAQKIKLIDPETYFKGDPRSINTLCLFNEDFNHKRKYFQTKILAGMEYKHIAFQDD